MKSLWISRINSFSRTHLNLTYSKFINAIKNRDIDINKKLISEIIFSEKEKTIEYFKQV